MNKPTLFIICVLVLVSGAFSQDLLPTGFDFRKNENGKYELLPKEDVIFDETSKEKAQEFVGLIAQPEEGLYGIILYLVQPEGKDFFLERQKEAKVNLSVGSINRSFSDYKVEKRQVRSRKIEVVTFQISSDEYENLLSSLLVIFLGDYRFGITDNNLSALKYFRTSVNNDLAVRKARELPVLNQSKEVRVKGYYRKDGTYVRPHARKRP